MSRVVAFIWFSQEYLSRFLEVDEIGAPLRKKEREREWRMSSEYNARMMKTFDVDILVGVDFSFIETNWSFAVDFEAEVSEVLLKTFSWKFGERFKLLKLRDYWKLFNGLSVVCLCVNIESLW